MYDQMHASIIRPILRSKNTTFIHYDYYINMTVMRNISGKLFYVIFLCKDESNSAKVYPQNKNFNE